MLTKTVCQEVLTDEETRSNSAGLCVFDSLPRALQFPDSSVEIAVERTLQSTLVFRGETVA